MIKYFVKKLQNEKIEKRFSIMFVLVITIFITVILIILMLYSTGLKSIKRKKRSRQTVK